MTSTAAAKPIPNLHLEGAPTFRDLGGIRVPGGRTASHRIYRSGAFTALTPAGVAMRDGLGIRLVCDLRTPMERGRFPVPWPDPVPKMLGASAGVDLYDTGEKRILALYAAETGQQAREVILDMYADMHREYAGILREIFVAVADERAFPLLIHCSAGKDRTGFVASLLLLALGVPEASVVDDYMLTDRNWGIEQVRHAVREKAGRDAPDAVLHALRVHPDYLNHGLATIRRQHGSVDGYLGALGLDDARRARLRAALVEQDAA